MFNKNFYPTPPQVADMMLAPLKLKGGDYVLEPSAGKGDLLDSIQRWATTKCNRWDMPKLYAIEIESELRAILEEKGYPVVGTDFLDYEPRVHFTHIVMNPPFDRAEEHILHAWHILYEGEIVALINATSLEGKIAKEKVLLKLIEDHGSVERIGQAFAHGAEAYTDAEIAIVRLTKKAGQGEHLNFDVTNDLANPEFGDGTGQELALPGFIDVLLAAYTAAYSRYANYNQSRQDILRYTAPFGSFYRNEDDKSVNPMEIADEKKTPAERFNTFVELLTEAAWAKILDHPGFKAILTERARKMMKEFRQRQRRVDFNEANIRRMLEAIVLKKDQLLDAAIQDAFDLMTRYHPKNRVHVEGWKSDLAWKVNQRVVLPYYIRKSYSGGYDINYNRYNEVADIDRAMCVIAGLPYDTICTIEAAVRAGDRRKQGESTFFKCRWFDKGTLHLTFKDTSLLKEFNHRAAKGRGWLGPGSQV